MATEKKVMRLTKGHAAARRGNSTRKGRPKRRGGISGGFTQAFNKSLAGQEDAEYTTMVFETTSAFTSTGGAASYLQIKGNSIYQPYPSVTSSPAGYQRMYTQYLVAQVLESKIEVRLWSNVGSVPEPFRIIIVPCTGGAYNTYSLYSNISSLAGVPHAVQAAFSPGDRMPRISASGTNATVIYGERDRSEAAELISKEYYQLNGADPANPWYFLVGYQNFAGTTTTNQQAQIKLSFKVKWIRPIPTAEQSVTLDYFGNEIHEKKLKSVRMPEGKEELQAVMAESEYADFVDWQKRRSISPAPLSMKTAARPGSSTGAGELTLARSVKIS